MCGVGGVSRGDRGRRAELRSCEVPRSPGPGPLPEDRGPRSGVIGVRAGGPGSPRRTRGHARERRAGQARERGRKGRGAGRLRASRKQRAPASPGAGERQPGGAAARNRNRAAPLAGKARSAGAAAEKSPPARHRWGRSSPESSRASPRPEPAGRGAERAGSERFVTDRTSKERGAPAPPSPDSAAQRGSARPCPHRHAVPTACVPGDRPPRPRPQPRRCSGGRASRTETCLGARGGLPAPAPREVGGITQVASWSPGPGPPPSSPAPFSPPSSPRPPRL